MEGGEHDVKIGEGTYWWNEVIWDIISFQNWDPRVDNRIVFHITLFHQYLKVRWSRTEE